MVTQILFTLLLGVLALQRLAELRLSRKNEAALLASGGREHAAGHFVFMQVLHTAWFAAALLEVWIFQRPFIPLLGAAALLLFLGGQALRYAAIRSLGPRWTVRVITLPDSPPVTGGIYRYIRHPNYLGVVLEIAALPLLHTAYLTAVVFSAANAILLLVRIRAEEQALSREIQYAEKFSGIPRFIPGGRRLFSARNQGSHEES
jgi:methyltransferase